jgi:hypothetical protein
MKRQQFNTIQEVDQASSLLKDGVLLAQRTEGFCRVLLYQADSYYLEVFRHNHFNVIIKVVSFTDTAFLEPYLEQIDIEELIPTTPPAPKGKG